MVPRDSRIGARTVALWRLRVAQLTGVALAELDGEIRLMPGTGGFHAAGRFRTLTRSGLQRCSMLKRSIVVLGSPDDFDELLQSMSYVGQRGIQFAVLGRRHFRKHRLYLVKTSDKLA